MSPFEAAAFSRPIRLLFRLVYCRCHDAVRHTDSHAPCLHAGPVSTTGLEPVQSAFCQLLQSPSVDLGVVGWSDNEVPREEKYLDVENVYRPVAAHRVIGEGFQSCDVSSIKSNVTGIGGTKTLLPRLLPGDSRL